MKRETIAHIILSPFIVAGWFDFLIRSGMAVGRGKAKKHLAAFLKVKP